MEPVNSIRSLSENRRIFHYDLFDPNAASFLGAFISEGNMTEKLSVKITCTNLEFINASMESVKRIFGSFGFTQKEPTNEDRFCKKGYHKYYRKLVARWLIEGFGVMPGKKILNDEGLPGFIMSNSNDLRTKKWLVNYLKMRYSGDGHVRNGINMGRHKSIITRRVALSRNNALSVKNDVLDEIIDNYAPKKPVKDYPPAILARLKEEMRKSCNFPKELIDIRILLLQLFGIKSGIYPYGVRCIYFDKKRSRYIVSAIYKLVVSRKDDIIKFHERINFADFDAYNKDRLLNLINSYKKEKSPDYSAGTIG